MKIQFSIVGTVERHPNMWCDLPVVPRFGETVHLPGIPEYDTNVRTIVWYPLVDDEDNEIEEPFVCIVLGRARTPDRMM